MYKLKEFQYKASEISTITKCDIKGKDIEDIYKILVIFLGKPPTNFKWEYYENSDKKRKITVNNLTPLEFD